MLPAVRIALAQAGGELSAEERAAIATGAAQPLKKAVAALDEATQRLAAILVDRAVRGR